MPELFHDYRKKAYSIPEVCALTGLGRSSIYTALNTGKLVAVKFGRRTVISAESIDGFLASLPRASFIKSVEAA